MRVSEFFNLSYESAELDFVDIDVREDKKLFLDPHALRLARTVWSTRAASLVASFFSHLLDQIRSGSSEAAHALLTRLMEPNETHLGYSAAKSRGHAVGPVSASDILNSLSKSRAVQTGTVRDLEDTVLLIAGIDKDLVSDMTTNVIRALLIEYTQQVCVIYNIPMQAALMGATWDPDSLMWRSGTAVQVPYGPDGPLLFVPKLLVRVTSELERGEYHRGFVTPRLQEEELAASSELVRLAKSGEPKVFKKDVNRKFGKGKATTIEVTQRHPELIDAYRRSRGDRMKRVPSQEQFARVLGVPTPKWAQMVARLTSIRPGDTGPAFGRRALGFLTAILHPNVTSPTELWLDGGAIGLRFVAIAAADGPLSPTLDEMPVVAVHAVAINAHCDDALARGLGDIVSPVVKDGEILILVARSFTEESRALLAETFKQTINIFVDDVTLVAAADARQQGNAADLTSLFKAA